MRLIKSLYVFGPVLMKTSVKDNLMQIRAPVLNEIPKTFFLTIITKTKDR